MKLPIKILILLLWALSSCHSQTSQNDTMKFKELTLEEAQVILHKGTERPFMGEYTYTKTSGTYLCKQCDAPLYRSTDKFESHCGWPSFDDEIKGAVKRVPDADGRRTEIVCANCGGHLGHVFEGEGYTQKNIRHCVNSISMTFMSDQQSIEPTKDTAIFAGGCFWGMQHHFTKVKGVISSAVGYIGGTVRNPTYEQVCSHTTGHVEALLVVFDPAQTNYETLAKLFFEIHDFTQTNGQGPDIGEQYLSEIFYVDAEQQKIVQNLMQILTEKGYKVATKLRPAEKFWKAEDYHQDYYEKKGSNPYCHIYKKIF